MWFLVHILIPAVIATFLVVWPMTSWALRTNRRWMALPTLIAGMAATVVLGLWVMPLFV